MSLQSEILDGLSRANWTDSVANVKRTIVRVLAQLDQRATITDTQYFNHSFVPDFVVTWADPARSPRDIFLRLADTPTALIDDLRFLSLSSGHPLFIGLAGSEASANDDLELSQALAARGAMAADSAAVEELAVGPTGDFSQVVPAALLRGGQGLVREQTAEVLVESASGFFDAAREHQPEALTESSAEIVRHLEPTEAGRLMRFGRVVWEATGGDPASYPAATDLAGLDDDGLRFLLEEGPGDDAEFWRAVGRTVTVERIVALGLTDSPNLTPLVNANADRLLARTLMVKGRQARLTDPQIRWVVEAASIGLRGYDFTAYFAARGSDLTAEPDEAQGARIDEAREATRDVRVEEVTLRTAEGKKVAITAAESFDLATDEILEALGNREGVRVASVGIDVAGKTLICNLQTRTAAGHTSAQFDMLSLLKLGLPILWPLTSESAAFIADVEAGVHALSPAQQLFPPRRALPAVRGELGPAIDQGE